MVEGSGGLSGGVAEEGEGEREEGEADEEESSAEDERAEDFSQGFGGDGMA